MARVEANGCYARAWPVFGRREQRLESRLQIHLGQVNRSIAKHQREQQPDLYAVDLGFAGIVRKPKLRGAITQSETFVWYKPAELETIGSCPVPEPEIFFAGNPRIGCRPRCGVSE